jgi:heterodisulfide reductase subunit C
MTMSYIQQILFVLVISSAIYILFRRISGIKRNILLGKDLDRSENSSSSFRNMILVAFGQSKMFKKPLPAFLHLFVYVGFIVINLEVLEFIIDGIAGTHRIFAPYLGFIYPILINFFEFLAIAVIVSCIIFLFRRNILKVKRFTNPEMTSWPILDANLILITEIVLMFAILTMNASDQILQARDTFHYPDTGLLFFSSFLTGPLEGLSTSSLIIVERFAWWFHIIGILAFAIYVTYSKHLHIFMAFPNTYYSNLESRGKMKNMESVTNEVKIMLGMPDANQDTSASPTEIGRFGAKDINDLTWKSLMDAYSCTECGRCTAECPANQTGKKLSPRKIMMDVRDRSEEVGRSLDKGGKGFEDGKTLLDNYISREEINACTSCNACTEACPVLIDPLGIILEMRRYIAMEESGSPADWNLMFQNIETSFSPWKFAPTDRFNWAKDLTNEQ